MIRYVLASFLLFALQADILVNAHRATDPNDFNARADLGLVIEHAAQAMDAFTPSSCFAGWWALERAAVQLLHRQLFWSVVGDRQGFDAAAFAYSVVDFEASLARKEVTCA